jgi:hypothetical protein
MAKKKKKKLSPTKYTQDFYELIYAQIAAAPVVTLLESELEVDTEFRLADRTHSDTRAEKRVQDLAEQLRSLALLNPLLVLEIADAGRTRKLVISGKKRLDAARKARLSEVPCKILSYSKVMPAFTKKWPEKKRRALMSEVLRSVSYSESAHHEPLTDEATYSLLLQIRKNQGLGKHDFDQIRERLGLSHLDPSYRSVLRLWRVACCNTAIELLQKKLVRLSTMKKDCNIQPIEDDKKGNAIFARINLYVTELRKSGRPEDQDSDALNIKAYRDSEVESIIRDVNLHGISDQGKEVDKYRAPQFSYKADRGQMRIPATTLDFDDYSPNNIRRIVEAYYKVKLILGQLQMFVEGIKPQEVGGVRMKGDWSPIDEGYGETYYRFILERNLQLYAHIAKIDEYLKPMVPLATANELKQRRSKAKKSELLIQKFKEHSERVRSEEESKRSQLRFISDERVHNISNVKPFEKKKSA